MAEGDLRLGQSFPRAPKQCKSVVDPFFACLLEHGTKKSADDTEAGMRGLAACQKEQKLYDACIARVEAKKPKPFYRVQEEYRT